MDLASENQGEVMNIQAKETSLVLKERQWEILSPVIEFHTNTLHEKESALDPSQTQRKPMLDDIATCK